MNTVTSVHVLAVLAFGFQIATAMVLFQKYRRTRSVGFLWLALTALTWPVLVQAPQLIIRLHLFGRGTITPGALSILVFYLKYFIGAGIVMAAVTYLCKAKDRQVISN